MKDRFVAKRYVNIVLMLLLTLAGSAVISLIHGRYLDEVIIYLFVGVVFMALFWFVLERGRKQKAIAGNRESTFRRVLQGYIMAWVLIIISSFLPEFLKPMLGVTLLMAAYGTQSIAIFTGIFFDSVLCLALGSPMEEIILYTLMTLFACMMAEALDRETFHKWYRLIIIALSTALPALFYYLAYREVQTTLLVWGALEGILIVILLQLLYPNAIYEKESEVSDLLEDMLDESYPLCREMKKFSKADYQHAQRVSRISAKCASLVGADEKLCEVAGLYYRVGILEGDSIVENGVRIAQRDCFPEEVIRIISEYNGEAELPSTIESAIVHMVDALVKKIEVFDSDTMSSSWNQNMVIYQTLNDFSAQGLYDKSGLSMNMFLKIREYLVNEEALL